MTWNRHVVTTDHNSQFSRSGHTLTFVRAHGLYVFGGIRKRLDEDGTLKEERTNTLIRIDRNSWTYSFVQVLEQQPTPRDGHASCLFFSNKIPRLCVYGGNDNQLTSTSNAAYIFHFETLKWIVCDLGHFLGNTSLIAHSSVVVGNDVIVFGGCLLYKDRSFEMSGKVLLIDLNTFTCRSVVHSGKSERIEGRACHSAVGFDERMYVFGGYVQSEAGQKWFTNEMLTLDTQLPKSPDKFEISKLQQQFMEFEFQLPASADLCLIQLQLVQENGTSPENGVMETKKDREELRIVSRVMTEGLRVLDDVWIELNRDRVKKVFSEFLSPTRFTRESCDVYSESSDDEDEEFISTPLTKKRYKMTAAERRIIRASDNKRAKKGTENYRLSENPFEISAGTLVPDSVTEDPQGEQALIRFSCVGKSDMDSQRRRAYRERPSSVPFRTFQPTRIPLVHEWSVPDDRLVSDTNVVDMLHNSAHTIYSSGLVQRPPGLYQSPRPSHIRAYRQPIGHGTNRYRSVISADWRNMGRGSGGINIKRLVESGSCPQQWRRLPPTQRRPIQPNEIIDLTKDDDDDIPQVDGCEVIVLDNIDEDSSSCRWWQDVGIFDRTKANVFDYWMRKLKIRDLASGRRLLEYLSIRRRTPTIPLMHPSMYRSVECRRPGRINLCANQSYRIRACAINGLGCSEWTESILCTTPPLNIPTRGPKTKVRACDDGSFEIQWEPIAKATVYSVYLIVNPGRGENVQRSFEESNAHQLSWICTSNERDYKIRQPALRNGYLRSWEEFGDKRATGYGFAVRGESVDGKGPFTFTFCRMFGQDKMNESEESSSERSSSDDLSISGQRDV
ncbi:hypothetical protein ACOME3_007106 [Neoechinorhynchus agilis]